LGEIAFLGTFERIIDIYGSTFKSGEDNSMIPEARSKNVGSGKDYDKYEFDDYF
jgi:hypothetical protein